MLHQLASRGKKCTLVMLDKGKMRDEPHLKHENIEIKKIKPSELFKTSVYISNKRFMWEPNLIIVSGEFFAVLPLINKFISKSCQIIGMPIGYEIEVLCVRNRSSAKLIHRNISSLISEGLTLCKHIIQNYNTPKMMRLELKRTNSWKKRLPHYQYLNIIRPKLSNTLLDLRENEENISNNTQAIKSDSLKKTIFVATRITSSLTNDSNNSKGSRDLFALLKKNAHLYSREGIQFLFINRDCFSNSFIKEIKEEIVDTQLKIMSMKELNYTDFLYILSRCMLAIDSFDLTNQLRPHMATADALSVGCPISTSWASTPHHALISDERLEIFDSQILEDINELKKIMSTNKDKCRRQVKQDWLYKYHYSLTDNAETDLLINIASKNNK